MKIFHKGQTFHKGIDLHWFCVSKLAISIIPFYTNYFRQLGWIELWGYLSFSLWRYPRFSLRSDMRWAKGTGDWCKMWTVWRQSGRKQFLQRSLEVEELRTLHFYTYEHLHAGGKKRQFQRCTNPKNPAWKKPYDLKSSLSCLPPSPKMPAPREILECYITTPRPNCLAFSPPVSAAALLYFHKNLHIIMLTFLNISISADLIVKLVLKCFRVYPFKRIFIPIRHSLLL